MFPPFTVKFSDVDEWVAEYREPHVVDHQLTELWAV